MFVVAITQLALSIEDESKALAADLGNTAYETRLILNGGLPAIVLQSPQREWAIFDVLMGIVAVPSEARTTVV